MDNSSSCPPAHPQAAGCTQAPQDSTTTGRIEQEMNSKTWPRAGPRQPDTYRFGGASTQNTTTIPTIFPAQHSIGSEAVTLPKSPVTFAEIRTKASRATPGGRPASQRLREALAEIAADSAPAMRTAAALCERASVSRNALYRYHRDILQDLHALQQRACPDPGQTNREVLRRGKKPAGCVNRSRSSRPWWTTTSRPGRRPARC